MARETAWTTKELVVLLLLALLSCVFSCPAKCECGKDNDLYYMDCSEVLPAIPDDIPAETMSV